MLESVYSHRNGYVGRIGAEGREGTEGLEEAGGDVAGESEGAGGSGREKEGGSWSEGAGVTSAIRKYMSVIVDYTLELGNTRKIRGNT